MMKIKSVAALAAAFMLLGSSALYVPAFAAQGSGFNVRPQLRNLTAKP